ncbi:HGxxPAAW family protein [Streptomyces monticola]|uniref:HGxxPAAW family protein n=1 Tax=Streptomyces monticola TaxID=2666263 RepID=A0ABW2JH33_9ACTN
MSGQHDEGHTIAGWAGCATATAGAAVTGAGICVWSPGIPLGIGVMAVAVLVTWVLHLSGWGKPPGPRPTDQRRLTVRDRSALKGHADCVSCRLAGRRPAPAPVSDPVVSAPSGDNVAVSTGS